MNKLHVFLMFSAFCVGLGLFKVKYQVMALENNYKNTLKLVSENKEAIHVLKAELTHLNDPERLQKLAVKHLNFVAINPSHIVTIKELPKNENENKINNLDKSGLDAIDELIKEIEIKQEHKNNVSA